MNPLALLTSLTRVRVAMVIAGLAWFVGINTSVLIRLVLGVLIAIAVAFDAVIEDQRTTRHPSAKPEPGYRPAA